MTERQQIIEDLLDFVADVSPYAGEHYDWMKVHRAIKYLKDKDQPRVLTLGEVMQSPDRLMWLQYKSANASDGYELHPTAPYGDDDPTWNRVTFQSGHIQTRGLYGRQWRCWSAKPDKERAVKWDDRV